MPDRKKQRVLFTDLDNTLIYSHRHPVPGPVVWVEMLHGKNQSFMTERTWRYFCGRESLRVIPVTTRTIRQYSRLEDAMADLGWHEALVCNGAIRLVDGQEDPQWREESEVISREAREPFRTALRLAYEQYGEDAVALEDPFLFYVKAEDPDAAFSFLSAQTDPEQLEVRRDSRKVYCFPKVLNKGRTVERYRQRFCPEACMAAGDSAFDIPMLRQADVYFCPEGLTVSPAPGKGVICTGLFSDAVCGELEKQGDLL